MIGFEHSHRGDEVGHIGGGRTVGAFEAALPQDGGFGWDGREVRGLRLKVPAAEGREQMRVVEIDDLDLADRVGTLADITEMAASLVESN